MTGSRILVIALLAALPLGCADERADSPPGVAAVDAARDWLQWGQGPRHAGAPELVGQNPVRILAEMVVDPFVSAETAETGGSLLAHYQAPLVVNDEVYMVAKSGRFVSCSPPGSRTPYPCGSDAWEAQTWSEKRLRLEGGRLTEVWSFASDWRPEPDAGGLGRWEPVFHPAISGGAVYVPGLGGTVHKVDRATGRALARINPFDAVRDDTFVAGPLASDAAGNVYYNALRLDLTPSPTQPRPWLHDVAGAWLVRIAPDDRASAVPLADLVTGAPAAADSCEGTFSAAELPWPPSPGARPPVRPCGGQRPGLNVAPAIAPDGTIYTVSRAHFSAAHGYLVAVNPDLTPRWAASLRGRLGDGCGRGLPANGAPGGCRAGAAPGVDPATNAAPAGQVNDLSTSSPVVAPDGSILYGAYTRYNYSRGHLMKFASGGQFIAAYDFGWDTTPAIYPHGGGYSVVIKENHYPTGSYCNNPVHCPRRPEGPYHITQLSDGLAPEWRFTNSETRSCRRNAGGGLDCVDDHPGGFEWCINAPAVDSAGVVYANSEDGNLYAIGQGGTLRTRTFLETAIGAAYTPLALGRDGRVYTQNGGHLFVLGQ